MLPAQDLRLRTHSAVIPQRFHRNSLSFSPGILANVALPAAAIATSDSRNSKALTTPPEQQTGAGGASATYRKRAAPEWLGRRGRAGGLAPNSAPIRTRSRSTGPETLPPGVPYPDNHPTSGPKLSKFNQYKPRKVVAFIDRRLSQNASEFRPTPSPARIEERGRPHPPY
jgi:hypothetical protein